MTILQKKIGQIFEKKNYFFSSNVTASKVSTAQISVHFENFLCNIVFSGALWFAAKKYFFFSIFVLRTVRSNSTKSPKGI